MKVPFPVKVPNGCPFTTHNIPFGIFSDKEEVGPSSQRRAGVAIGDYVLDLHALVEHKVFAEAKLDHALDGIFLAPDLNAFAALPSSYRSRVRATIVKILQDGSSVLFNDEELNRQAFVHMEKVQMHVPMSIGDYTDFFSSYVHAQNCLHPLGIAIPAAFHEYPMGYNGRISSISVSGNPVIRPKGFYPAEDSKHPIYQPSQQLDFEVEMAAFIGTPIPPGTNVTAENAADHIFGYVLLNDWSARDIQKYEMAPFGPFHSKSFLTSISPWVVTLDALRPSQAKQLESLAGDHLAPTLRCDEKDHGLFDVELSAKLSRDDSGDVQIIQTNLNSSYWSPYQMVAYQSSSGCGLRTGDLLGTGTLSCSPSSAAHVPAINGHNDVNGQQQQSSGTVASYGCLTEIHAVSHTLPEVGGRRVEWLEDGDTFSYEGWFRTEDGEMAGFGGVSGTVVPARE